VSGGFASKRAGSISSILNSYRQLSPTTAAEMTMAIVRYLDDPEGFDWRAEYEHAAKVRRKAMR